MAHVKLVPIGSPREEALDAASRRRNRAALQEREAQLEERRAKVQAGWGPTYVERVHQKGKLTARERIEKLRDAGSELFEVGTFANWGRAFGKLESPAAGVVTVFARIHARW